jgi:hypothetical protein
MTILEQQEIAGQLPSQSQSWKSLAEMKYGFSSNGRRASK